MKEFHLKAAKPFCRMRLSLMGMSGSGKSYWSQKLAEHGFKRFCCDALIAQKLRSQLTAADGSPVEMGKWMGFPYEPGYRTREAQYLACEVEVVREILEYLRNTTESDENIVVDTTGSVVYTGDAILEELHRRTTIIHLSNPPEVQELMFKAYVAHPTPLLWRELFQMAPSETREAALTRCYAELLSSREKLYRKYAAMEIGYFTRRGKEFDVEELLAAVENHCSGQSSSVSAL